MKIPSTLISGDSVVWRDDPTVDSLGNAVTSATHTLTYALRGATVLTVTGVAYNGGWETQITAAQSGQLTASEYGWQAYATAGIERLTIGVGKLLILPNLSTQTAPYEARSQTKIDLDAVEAAIRAMISNNAVQEYSIGNRPIKKMTLTDLTTLRSELRYQLAIERRTELIANGQGDPHSLFVRF